MKRRDFLLHSAAGAAALGAGSAVLPRLVQAAVPHEPLDAAVSRELAMRALDAARSAGATYADFRLAANRSQALGTRERQITFFNDSETFGFGVRVIANGSWGFAASRDLNAEEVVRVAQQAVAQARANAATRQRPLELAPVEAVPDGKWSSPMEIDPFSVTVEEKVDLLLRANAAALGVQGARFVNSNMFALRLGKTFASTDGSYIEQTIHRSFPRLNITAVAPDGSDFQTRASTDVAPMALGYEHVRDARLVENAPRWAEDAVAKLTAKSVDPGRYDLVLLPTHLWLTIHESIAHPTELDRIMGFEANYAGTSFIYPIADFLGKFRYGQSFMNIQGERTSPGGLSSIGWDDEGVRPDEFLIVKDGMLNDLQTTREQAPWLGDWYRSQGKPVRSHGNSYAESWDAVQFQRMPNVNLLPNQERDVSVDELVSGIENGILIDGDGSFSIDQQRFNAQFGGQVFKEIKNGRITGPLKDVAYQMRTPEFWNSMDLIGGASTVFQGGSFFDGKGQPSQSNAVSHSSPAARFRQVNVINTGRRG
jgi:TldD protein